MSARERKRSRRVVLSFSHDHAPYIDTNCSLHYSGPAHARLVGITPPAQRRQQGSQFHLEPHRCRNKNPNTLITEYTERRPVTTLV